MATREQQIPIGNDSQKGKGNSNCKGRSRSLRDDSQKGKGNGKNQYRGLSTSLRFGRDDEAIW
jgi:hypothetical protein